MNVYNIPYPPSANRIWRVANGKTYRSREYVDFLAVVKAIVWQAGRPEKASAYAVEILVYPPDKRRRDLDNVIKPTLDALTKAGVWNDDSAVCELAIKRSETRKGGECVVKVKGV